MAKPGPAAFDREKLARTGSSKAKHRSKTLKLSPGEPSMPTTLDKEAKAEWKRVVPGLARAGAIAKEDRAALSLMCESWSEIQALSKQIRDIKEFTVDKKHLMTAKHQAYGRWESLARRFGLTPEDRTRVPVTELATNGEANGAGEGQSQEEGQEATNEKSHFFDKAHGVIGRISKSA